MRTNLAAFIAILLTFCFSTTNAAGHLELRAASSKCNADNCYRAVVASNAKPFPSSASADCSSFMQVTVTPCPTTSTSTTVVATTTIGSAPDRRQIDAKVALQARSTMDATCTAPTTTKPTAVPGYASSACGPAASVSARYSSACSCKGQTVTTVTSSASAIIATQTIGSVAVPASCNNKGFQWFYYGSYNPALDSPDHYDTFDPTSFDNVAPDFSGTTDTIGGFHYTQPDGTGDDDSQNIYGQEVPWDYYTIDHQAYFLAPVDGTYTFAFSNVDDLAVFYLGSKAYSGYTKNNYDFRGTFYYDNGEQGGASQSFNLKQGQYYPIRIFFTDANVDAGFNFVTTGPAPFDQPGTLNNFFVQSSCDSSSAPAFPPLPHSSGSSSQQSNAVA